MTIGPRLGFAFSHESFENFKEDGDTGLELQYHNLNQTSLQSSLGVQASVGLETAYGVVVPQAVVAWVHEYANDDRNIDARLVEAPAGPSFTFQREPPARDWATSASASPLCCRTDSSRSPSSRPCRATKTS
jgi:outer membrane lipase/esterase